MKKTSKILVALCIILMIIAISVVSYGTNASSVLAGLNGDTAVNGTKVMNLGNTIIGTVQVIGIVVAVVILLILGIKYMMGSAEEKADYKKSMIPYLVGAVIIFAATSIVRVVYDLATSLSDSGTPASH